MSQNIDINELLILRKNFPVIDVRSPVEYSHGHIPGSINIPLFNDNERAAVGTVYVKKGREEALLLALELAGPQLKEKVITLKSVYKNGKLLVHCWRGGIRSLSMAWLFDLFGYESLILKGGYKAYRRKIKEDFNCNAKIITIGGMTGSGKTKILEYLENHGHQVINLEKLANHKGSVFGNLAMGLQPTTEQFENDIFERWQFLDFSKVIFFEDESRSIGKVNIPTELYEKMQVSPVIEIIVDKKIRIESLVKDYASYDKTLLKEGVEKIKKRLGGLNAKQAISAIDERQFQLAIDIILQYYDKAYKEVILSRKADNHFPLNALTDDAEVNVSEILKLIIKNNIYGTGKIDSI